MSEPSRDIVMVVPTRGRPGAVEPMVAAFANTSTTSTGLVFAVDLDDPLRDEYRAAVRRERLAGAPVSLGTVTPGGSMVVALNTVAHALKSGPYAIGFMGDDHRPRTTGWDAVYLRALRELGSGMVFGDDRVQGAKLPTHIVMTSDIVETLGYMAPPELQHLFVDDWWLKVGCGAGALRYLPDVTVEHLHPVAGTADTDPGYERVNSPAMYQRDALTFAELQSSGKLQRDIDRVNALRARGSVRHA